MRAIYAVYNRNKCEELDTIVRMIDGFENREQEMVDACYKKYAIVGPDAHTPRQAPRLVLTGHSSYHQLANDYQEANDSQDIDHHAFADDIGMQPTFAL